MFVTLKKLTKSSADMKKKTKHDTDLVPGVPTIGEMQSVHYDKNRGQLIKKEAS